MNSYDRRLHDALVKEHESVFDYTTQLLRKDLSEHIPCPVCGSGRARIALRKDWFTFAQCSDCGMVYLNPRLNDKATYQFYEGAWTRVYNEQKFQADTASSRTDDRINADNLRAIQAMKAGKGNLLEVGIGKGYLLKQAQQAGYTVYGVELNTGNCESAARLLGTGENIFNGNLFEAKYPPEHFDVIYMKDVFEHVPNPRALMEEFGRIAARGCLIFIEVPNIEGWIYKVVRERHVCIFAFEHPNYWSPRTLSNLLASCGFTVTAIHHESRDFTLASIISYFIESSFTAVMQYRASPVPRLMLRGARKVLSIPPLSLLDGLLRHVADAFGHGSVIRVFAEKKAPAQTPGG